MASHTVQTQGVCRVETNEGENQGIFLIAL